nr:hypothetical protein [Tanacetum cinerariifolium]
NCKRVGHLTRDYRSPAATNNYRNPTCYECGNQGHYKSDSSELKNQDQGNQAGGTGAHGMVQALEGGETNQDRNDVEDDPLPSAKIAQAKEIADLKKRVKKLKRKKKSRTSGRMIDNVDQNKEITLVDETQGRMNEKEMFRLNDLDGDEVIVDATVGEEVEQSRKVAEKEVSAADPVTTGGKIVTTAEDVEVTTAATTPQISKDERTLAQTLIEIKEAKSKARGVIVQEPSEFRTTSSSQPS